MKQHSPQIFEADGIAMTVDNWANMFAVTQGTIRKWIALHQLPIPPQSPRNAKRLAAWEYVRVRKDEYFEQAPEGGIRIRKTKPPYLSSYANTSSVAGKKIHYGRVDTYIPVFPDTNIPRPVVSRVTIRK